MPQAAVSPEVDAAPLLQLSSRLHAAQCLSPAKHLPHAVSTRHELSQTPAVTGLVQGSSADIKPLRHCQSAQGYTCRMRRNFALTEEVYPPRTRDFVKSLHTQGLLKRCNLSCLCSKPEDRAHCST